MSDLEEQLGAALHEGADGAPSPIGLADGARRRARARRRHRVAAVGVAVVLAFGVPSGVVALRGSHPESHRTAAAPPAAPVAVPADPGYRWESWHGVSVQVPANWGQGPLASWCANGGSASPPRVERPGQADLVRCHPHETYGLRFSVALSPGLNWPVAPQLNDYYPPQTFVGTRDLAGVFIEVGTPSAALSQRILDSVVVDDRVFPDGCAATISDESAEVGWASMSVCEYDADGLLSRTRQLDAADSAAAEAALAKAPALTQCPDPGRDPLVVLRSKNMNAVVDLQASCLYEPGDGSPRTVTDEVRTWATLPAAQ